MILTESLGGKKRPGLLSTDIWSNGNAPFYLRPQLFLGKKRLLTSSPAGAWQVICCKFICCFKSCDSLGPAWIIGHSSTWISCISVTEADWLDGVHGEDRTAGKERVGQGGEGVDGVRDRKEERWMRAPERRDGSCVWRQIQRVACREPFYWQQYLRGLWWNWLGSSTGQHRWHVCEAMRIDVSFCGDMLISTVPTKPNETQPPLTPSKNHLGFKLVSWL